MSTSKYKYLIRILMWVISIIGIFVIITVLVWFSTGSVRKTVSQDYQKDAEKLIENHEYDDAILALNKAGFFDPSNDQAWYELGKIHRSFYEYTLSSKSFLRSWKAKEDDKYLIAYIESLLKNDESDIAEEFLVSIDESDLSNSLLWLIKAEDQKLSDAKKYANKIKRKSQKNYFLSLTNLLEEDYRKFAETLKNIQIHKSNSETPDFACPECNRRVIWKLYPDSNTLSSLKSANNKILNSQIAESKSLYSYQAFAELGLGSIVIEPLKDLIADNLNYRDACIVLGEIYYLEENYTTALEKLKSAEKLDYNYLPTLQLLYKTYLALDQADKVEDYNLRIEKLQFEN
ncbi:MAG: hypothetical protein ABH837_02590 [bacterium]